jgi:hypothetical protein
MPDDVRRKSMARKGNGLHGSLQQMHPPIAC